MLFATNCSKNTKTCLSFLLQVDTFYSFGKFLNFKHLVYGDIMYLGYTLKNELAIEITCNLNLKT